MKINILKDKSYNFALSIIKLFQSITLERREFVLSKQIIKSGTSIGADVEEANRGNKKKDFNHKLGIAQKEAHETHYWLRLLTDRGYLDKILSASLIADCEELIKLITTSVKTAKNNLNNSECNNIYLALSINPFTIKH